MTPTLTDRQREMVEAYGELGSIPAIAEKMGLSSHTVTEHLRIARRKLNVRFTIEAVWALRSRRKT